MHIDRVVEQQHRFNASLADKKAQPYDMWSFHGSSYDWGKDDVIKLTRTFSQPNLMGADGERRLRRRHSGGGVLDGFCRRGGWATSRLCR